MVDLRRQPSAGSLSRRRLESSVYACISPDGWPPARNPETPEAHALWGEVFRALASVHKTAASRRYHAALGLFDLNDDRLPKLATINQKLAHTGFRMAPTAGYVEPAQFFAQLWRGIFLSTLYLRDPKTPHFTPEPDYIHELMGHGVMLADPSYAAISRTLAGASVALQQMGASPQRLARIERIYWYTMETGLVRENGELRAYGAAVLSSVRELVAIGEHPPHKLSLDAAAERPYAFNDLQPVYFYCDNLDDLCGQISAWVTRELHDAQVELGLRAPLRRPGLNSLVKQADVRCHSSTVNSLSKTTED